MGPSTALGITWGASGACSTQDDINTVLHSASYVRMLLTGRAAGRQAQVEKVCKRLWRTWAAMVPCTAPLMTCVALGACGNGRPSHNVYRGVRRHPWTGLQQGWALFL